MYTIGELKSIISPIALKHGVKRVAVFGSVARGDAHADSDVDLLIEKGEIKSLLGLAAFYLDVEDALKTSVDIVTTGACDKEFLRSISRDEVTVYEQ